MYLSVIKRFEGSSENADDLFQIGCVGLMKAVDHFDPDRLVKFSTYAVPMIIGEIRRYLRDNSSIRVSRLAPGYRIQGDLCKRRICQTLHERADCSGNRG